MQTVEEMIEAGATPEDAAKALELFDFLRLGLKLKRSGRVDTARGDKTLLGLYYSVRCIVKKEKGTCGP